MRDSFNNLVDRVFAISAQALPELILPEDGASGTIFTSVQSLRFSIVNFTFDALTSASCIKPPPYLFWDFGKAVTPPDLGVTGDIKMIKPRAFYFTADDPGASRSVAEDDVHERLYQLQPAIDNGENATFESVSFASFDTSPSNPVTAALCGKSKVRFVAGMLEWPDGWYVGVT